MFKRIEFKKAVQTPESFTDEGMVEVALIGRSNSGKSSFINMLFNNSRLARISKEPGRTAQINYFAVDDRFYFCDLPGYGFSIAQKKLHKLWQGLMDVFLQREQLKLAFIIHDTRRLPDETDWQLWRSIYEHCPVIFIISKKDKLNKSEFQKQEKLLLSLLDQNLGIPKERVHFTSTLQKNDQQIQLIQEAIDQELEFIDK